MSGLLAKKQRISTSETAVGALRLQSSAQGTPIPLVIGTTRIAPALLDYFDFEALPQTETTRSGGKGGGGAEISNTTYTYTVGVILGLCLGPSAAGNAAIGTAWSGKDVTDAATMGLTVYAGDGNQTAWPYMVAEHNTNAEAYRGICYAATSALDLGGSPSLPVLGFEVTGLGGANDVNCANAVTIVLTGEGYGAGLDPARLGDLTDWHDYCTAAGIAIAPAYTAQRPAAEVASEIAQIGNAGIVWSEGKLKIRPLADAPVGAWSPNLTPVASLTAGMDLIADTGQPAVRIRRGREADRKNVVRLNIRDRENGYNQAVVKADDLAHIEAFGERAEDPIDLPAINRLDVGRTVAQLRLQRLLYLPSTYEFRVGWRHARLEPLDPVTLTDPLTDLNAQLVRVLTIEEDAEGTLTCTAEDLGTGAGTAGTYGTQAGTGAAPAGAAPPGDTYTPLIIQPPLALSGKPQVWLGAQGGAEWGGAQVWVSVDGGASYALAGTLTGAARYGVTTGAVSATADPDTSSTIGVDLTASRGALADASTAAANALETLCWLGGEVIAYSAATLTATYTYDLDTYIRRGQAGTLPAAHSSGADFMRLDAAVGRYDISASLYGTTIYVKLLSFNRRGGGLQALADVTAHAFAIQPQAATGSGFAWVLDSGNTAMADPGAGRLRVDAATLSSATQIAFDELTSDGANMAVFFAGLGDTARLELRAYSNPAAWAAYAVTGANLPGGYQVLDVTIQAAGTQPLNGETMIATFTPVTVAGAAGVLTINPQTGNYTLQASDYNTPTLVEITSANASVLTVPTNANVPNIIGASVLIARGGAGNVTVSAPGVTLESAGNAVALRAEDSVATLICTAEDVWRLAGDLS